MISVLMPAKDAGGHFDQAVVSTLAALRQEDELVVVDDGSTDGTGARLAAHAARDRRVRVIHHEHPAGVAASLNEALGAARGDLIARMDADDVCLRGRFARQTRELAGADLHFSSVVKVDGRGRPFGATPPLPVSPAAAGALLTLGNFFIHPTMLARRAVLTELGGYRPVQVEDYDLWVHAVARGHRLTVGVLPAVRFRRHAAQVTHAWRPADPSAEFLEGFRVLLPEDLRSDDALLLELARSATRRVRDTPAARAAWSRLRTAVRVLPAVATRADRLHLSLRIAAIDRAVRKA